MSRRFQLVINFIGFQIAWFACVLMAANNQPLIGITVAFLVVALHLYLAENRARTISLLAVITLIGSTWDSILTSQKILVFSSGMILPFLAPTWIVAMWLSFATTITITFRWLYQRYILAFVLGSISGPLAYQAGASLGAVTIPDNITANILLTIGWGVLMPLFLFIAQAFENINNNGVVKHEH